MIEPAPCLCGCAWHDAPCKCGCPFAAPDYVAAAAFELAALPDDKRTLAERDLRLAQDKLARQLRWVGPPRQGKAKELHEKVCAYCAQPFLSPRAQELTCSGACRQARSVALRYESDADVPSVVFRHDVFSESRREATGYGLLTASESYEADLRVRREQRTA